MITKSIAILFTIALSVVWFLGFNIKEVPKPMTMTPVVVECLHTGTKVAPYVQYEQWLDNEPTIVHTSLTQQCVAGRSTLSWFTEGEPVVRYTEKEGEIDLGIAEIKMVGRIPTRFENGMNEPLVILGNELTYAGSVNILASNDTVVVNGIIYPVLRVEFHILFENGIEATRVVWVQDNGLPVKEIWDSGQGYTLTRELTEEDYDRESHIGIAER